MSGKEGVQKDEHADQYTGVNVQEEVHLFGNVYRWNESLLKRHFRWGYMLNLHRWIGIFKKSQNNKLREIINTLLFKGEVLTWFSIIFLPFCFAGEMDNWFFFVLWSKFSSLDPAPNFCFLVIVKIAKPA